MSDSLRARSSADATSIVLPGIAFLAGAAALLFETLWYRSAGLVFGNGVWASSLVLAAFMAGLAVGNVLAAVAADRTSRPLYVYACIEILIGASGALLVIGLPGMTDALAPAFRALHDTPLLLNVLRGVLAFAAMMVPAAAMGATLPLLVRALRTRDLRFGPALGRLYGWNTLGAMLGAVAGELCLIGRFGVTGTAWIAASWNALAALLAVGLAIGVGDRFASSPRAGESPIAEMDRRSAGFGWIAASFASGALFLALEVVWFRFLSLFVFGTSLVFAVMLATVLAGIGLGGVTAAHVLRRPGRAIGMLAPLALLGGAFNWLGYEIFGDVLDQLLSPGGAAAAPLHVAALTVPLVFPVSFLSGVFFTSLGEVIRERLGSDGRATGWLAFANTGGAALGSLAGGFLLLPGLGIERSLLWIGVGYGLLGASLLRSGGTRTAPAIAAAMWCVALASFPFGSLRDRHLLHPLGVLGEAESRIVEVREGRLETIVRIESDRLGVPHHQRIVTNAFSMSGTHYPSRRYMKAFVYLPVALHPEPRRALLISYGIGSTARALADTKELEHVDVVDISGDILAMSDRVFDPVERNPLRDPRVHTHVEDGRFFLQTETSRYDLITSEPSPPKLAGVVNLFTLEYFELLRERLAPGGLVSYWLPAHDLDPDDARAILRAFCEVFPDCTLWNASGLDWMLLGTRGPQAASPIDLAHFSRPWRDPETARELAALGFERPEQLLATFLADEERITPLIAETPPLSDDHPQRLSHRPVHVADLVELPFYRRLSDADAARAAFRRSRFARERLSPRLRESALPWFEWQGMINRHLIPGIGAPLDERDLVRVLEDSPLRTLPLWMLGSDVAEQRILAGLPDSASDRLDVQLARGIGSLAARDYAAADAVFFGIRGGGREQLRGSALAALSRCLLDDRAGAAQRARQLLASTPSAAETDAFWQVLSEVCSMPDPRPRRRRVPR